MVDVGTLCIRTVYEKKRHSFQSAVFFINISLFQHGRRVQVDSVIAEAEEGSLELYLVPL